MTQFGAKVAVNGLTCGKSFVSLLEDPYADSRERCMGYHTSKAKNIPENFICFDCRIRADQNWDLILVHNLHPRMMDKYKDLSLFR